MSEVYLYGQVLGTHSFYLRDGFLQPDEYWNCQPYRNNPKTTIRSDENTEKR